MEDKKIQAMHNVIMENRAKLTLTGVKDIHSFDDELVLVETEMGILTIKGVDLKMNKLNLDNTELSVEGRIIALVYSESEIEKKGKMFNKIFK
ncbi:MAG: sporulation protein YabP [Clostridia bacterium]|nr:sporulation protein YabP [Clostridia bacterium]